MINFAMVGYYVSDCGCKNNEFVKLKKGGYKTPAQLEKEGYKVVQFHGIISDQEVRHTGYVFIRGKEVTIAYRGTCNSYDFKRDVEIPLIRQYELLPKGGKIHLGFYSVFENSWESLYGILKGYANDQGLEIRDLKINLTGHSMGGAVANIAALCLSVTEDAKDLHIATFGAPRVFNRNAAKVCNELFGRKTIRVVDRSDSIPSLPPNFMGYKHVGKQLKIGRHSVPALHDHKLEVYHDLILKIKPKNFKSDNNTSATCYILSRTAREVYDVLTVPSCLIPSTHSSSDKQYFERVKDQHKNASFSEIINIYSELSNRNDKFLDKDRRNGIMGDIRASIKKPRGNYNKEGVMTKFKEQSEKSVSLGGGLPNIDNLTNSKGGSTINLREQNKRDETSLVESFEKWANSGEIFDIGSPNNLEEGEKTVVERVEYFNKYLNNPKPSKHTRLGVPTMGVNQVHLKQSKKKSVSLGGGLSDVNILTNSGIETPDADKSTNSKEERQSKKGSVQKRLSNFFRPKKKTQSNERSTSLRELFTLRETINEAEAEINGLQGEEKNQQESKLKEIKELFPFSRIQTNQGKAIEEILCNVLESVDLETVKLIVGQKKIYITASAEFA
ncbi:lipase family protein [Wolbachia endosymbiont (group A) of Hedychridium roseum]